MVEYLASNQKMRFRLPLPAPNALLTQLDRVIAFLGRIGFRGDVMEELTTQFKGTITEMQVALALLKRGLTVSRPLVESRYDLVLEYQEKFYRIQIKTSRLKEDKSVIIFNTSNSHTNTKGTTNRNYKGDVDFFATYYNGDCYLIPVDDCGNRAKTLRLKKTKNGQITGISFLENYTVEKILLNN